MIEAYAACQEAVRKSDPDRFFAALFAPEAARPHLMALTAFHGELAHAARAAREPLLRQMRLVWWREGLQAARTAKSGEHPVLQALATTLAQYDLPEMDFEAMIAARAGDEMAPEDHADATTGSLMRLWGHVLGATADMRDAAIAYGLAAKGDAALVRAHYDRARAIPYPRAVLPAVLPAALVPLYLKRAEPALWRKQIALYFAAIRGRI